MGYAASFRDNPITIDPPLNGKAIEAWHNKHQRYVRTADADHFCSVVLDIAKQEIPDDQGDVLVKRRAASFHIDGDDLREDATIKDVRDLIEHADQHGSRVYGTIVQIDGHPDFTYPVRWVVGHGDVEAQRPVLLYPLDPDGIGALAIAASKHTGVKNDDDLHGTVGGVVPANHWGTQEANSVATDMIRDLYEALKRRDV